MFAATLLVAVATLICLVPDTTKRIGVACVALLFYLQPRSFTALLVLGVVAVIFNHRRNQRRKYYEHSRPAARRN